MTRTTTTAPRSAIRRIAIARAISLTGGAAAFIALNFRIYELTGSATWLAATMFLTFGVVGLVGPLAGMLGDRVDRRRLMIVSDLAGAACFAALGLLDSPGALLAVAFAAAVVETPFRAASAAAIPSLIGDETQLGWANGLVSMGSSAGILMGPAIGGALVALVSVRAVFFVNAVSFVLSALLVATVHGRFREERAPGEVHEHDGISAGFRVLFGDRVLRTIALAWVAIAAGGSLCMVADVPLANLFDAGAFGYGLMIAAFGAGLLLGSFAGRWSNERNEPMVLISGAAVIAVGTGVVAISPVFWPVCVAILVAGFGDAFMTVAEQSMFQRRAADAVRSRVFAALDATVQICMAFAFVVAGPIVATIGPRPAYLVGGASALFAVVLVVPIRKWRAAELRAERQEPGTEGAAEALAV